MCQSTVLVSVSRWLAFCHSGGARGGNQYARCLAPSTVEPDPCLANCTRLIRDNGVDLGLARISLSFSLVVVFDPVRQCPGHRADGYPRRLLATSGASCLPASRARSPRCAMPRGFPRKASCHGWCPCLPASRARSPQCAMPQDFPAQGFLPRVMPLALLHPAHGRLGVPCHGVFPRKASCHGWCPLPSCIPRTVASARHATGFPAQGFLPRVVPLPSCIPRTVASVRHATGFSSTSFLPRVVPLAFLHPAHGRLGAPCHGVFPRKASCHGWCPCLPASRARSPRCAMPRGFPAQGFLPRVVPFLPASRARSPRRVMQRGFPAQGFLPRVVPLAFLHPAHGRLGASCNGVFPRKASCHGWCPCLPASRARSPRCAMPRGFRAQGFLPRVVPLPSCIPRTVASVRPCHGIFPHKASCHGWCLLPSCIPRTVASARHATGFSRARLLATGGASCLPPAPGRLGAPCNGVFPRKASCHGWCLLPSGIPRPVASVRHATGFSRARLLATGGASCLPASRARSPRCAMPHVFPRKASGHG